jgi:RNA polymerase sigma-70 factor (ECF subfamily)
MFEAAIRHGTYMRPDGHRHARETMYPAVPANVVSRACQGDAHAFSEIAQSYGNFLHRLLALRLGDTEDARDALQETLIAAWTGIRRLKKADSLGPWLIGIALHKASDVHRQRLRRQHQNSDFAIPAISDGDSQTVNGIIVRDAFRRLPPKMRAVLLLRYLLGLSERESARVLGVRIGTVKSRASRARHELEIALGDSISQLEK